jgi:hypothetical protein
MRKHLTYADVAATLALVIAISGGVAYAANTIFSTDIVDGEVKSVDIGDRQVQGVDVKDRSLRGVDLGVRVRSDKQVDDGSLASECGKGTDFDECITVLLNVPRRQRLLLIGSGEWFGSVAGGNSGECRFAGVGFPSDLGLRRFGEPSNVHIPGDFAMNSVSPALAAGTYEISIECRDTSLQGGNVVVKRAEVSVAALGDG